MTFINNAAPWGGAVSNYGIVNIDHSVFDGNDNIARTYNGASAIYNERGNLTVNNTVFKNNLKVKANRTNDDNIRGIITNYNGNMYIYNSNFTNNSGVYGGAITTSTYNYPAIVTIIDNCRFVDNTAYNGAAINANGKVDLKVNNSYFENNVASEYGDETAAGGAICLVKVTEQVTIYNNTFKGNKAINGAAPDGGAISIDESPVNVDLCTFEDNTADIGGAVSANAGSTLSVTRSSFNGNNANKGTAVYNTGDLTVSNNTFGENDKIDSKTQVNKDGSNVTISPIANVTYGTPVVVSYSINNRTSNVTVSVSHKNGEIITPATTAVVIVNDNKVTITNLTAGQYAINIVNNEDNNIATSFTSAVFNVTKATPIFDVKAYVNDFGIIVVNVTTNKDATDNVTFKIDDDEAISIAIENGFAIFDELGEYAKGIHNITVTYDGDVNYEKVSNKTTVEITKDVPVIEIESIKVNEYGAIVVKANITKGATGNVTFDFYNTNTGKNLTGVVIPIGENGTIEYDEGTPFEKGYWNVQIGYAGDANYYPQAENTQRDVNVTKNTASLDIIIITVEKNITVKVIANDTNVSGQVNITVFDLDGNVTANKTVDMVKGVVEYKFTDIEIGDYKVLAEFLGSDDFYQTFTEDMAYVRAPVEMNVTATVDNYGRIKLVANLTKGATGTVKFIISNTSFDPVANLTVEVKNATATDFTTVVLDKEFYHINAIYSGDDYYANASYYYGSVEITKEYLNVTSKIIIEDGANQATIIFTLSGNATGNVTAFFLNYGTNNTYAIQNGTVVIDEIFDNGAQSVLLTYEGDTKYYGFYEVHADFFVKASSFISAKPVSVVYQNTGKVTVTLTDNNDLKGNNPIANAEVVITLNGKTYKGNTNAKGIATISIPAKLVPKAYTATVLYKGTNVTVGDTATFKFTVKKAKAKITAKKKTFKKSKKVKKYTITLKDNKAKAIKKAKVTIKVGKKTFKAKTNAKGKAVFKLKKLTKKAKYKAKITYKGNKYFNKVTKKVKITIK